MIRVVLPAHLRKLSGTAGQTEVQLDLDGPVTQRTVIEALEVRYPPLRGTVRDHATQRRRAFVRFYVGADDLSNADPDDPLPASVATGEEPLRIVGAMAGG